MPKELEVHLKQTGENFIECIVGENDNLKIVGTIRHYFYRGEYRGTSYTPRNTELSSFHARDNALENFLVRLAPGKETLLQIGDQIWWGYKQPTVCVELDHPFISDSKKKN